jgi:hypothetical protein
VEQAGSMSPPTLEPIECGSWSGHHSGCECGETIGYFISVEGAALMRRYEEALETIARNDHQKSQACDAGEAAAAIARNTLRPTHRHNTSEGKLSG